MRMFELPSLLRRGLEKTKKEDGLQPKPKLSLHHLRTISNPYFLINSS